ncbi:MAG TPA: RNA-guided endonuclease TnpB family protein [Ktedonobacteraceae bacterium]|nr:RNA-guided endonuclease TnpB family protein [Ktedonobacteraceae bacterium]
MKQKRAYKYRIYPTDEQARHLARTFGCARYVYNWALRLRTDAYYKEQMRVGYHETSAQLTLLKKQEDRAWLNEVSCVPLQQALRHLDKAFKNFFEGHAAYPKFHKKHNEQSAEYTTSAFKWDGKSLTLAKMESPLDIHWSRPLPKGAKPSTVTVSKDCANRYFVSLLIEEDIKHSPLINKQIGLDLGLKSMVITSDGHTYGNPKFFVKEEKKLAKAQRRHARKKKGSKNRAKACVKVARVHARIADRRRDSQHKLSTKIIRENQIVCIESLHIKNMVKNYCLAKAISDVGWSELVRQLEYKAQWYGRTLVKIDKWYPSSKRCFDCGHILDSLPLDIRQWTCPECGVHHDRDINAAKNILVAGQAILACGESVTPGRAFTLPGKTPRSRKAHP